MYIGYDTKNGVRYAKLCSAKRVDGKVVSTQKSLGRVIDEKKGIYQNRERGIFTFDVKTGTYGKPKASITSEETLRQEMSKRPILNFGDAYVLDQFLTKVGMWDVVDCIGYDHPDTLHAIVLYSILESQDYASASVWYEGSYARLLYPKADLSSERINELLSSFADVSRQRQFFAAYLKINGGNAQENILIETIGLPQSRRFPITAISKHNGVLSDEIQLFSVVRKGTNQPLFFKEVPTSQSYESTLGVTLSELKSYGIEISCALLDDACLTESNLAQLIQQKVSILSRLEESRKEYSILRDTYLNSLKTKENLMEFNGRNIYVKRVQTKIMGQDVSAYLCLEQNLVILYSSMLLETKEVLSRYALKEQVEQFFEMDKHYQNLLPLCVRSEDMLRGHLLLTFIAFAVAQMLQESLKNTNYRVDFVLNCLSQTHCIVFDKSVVPTKPGMVVSDILKALEIAYPEEIPVSLSDNPEITIM